MFIENGGPPAYLEPTGILATLAMTVPTGSVLVEQQGEGDDDWFEYKYDGISAGLDANNTARGIYCHLRFKVTATGTGVRLYDGKRQNQKHNIIITPEA